MKLVILTFLIFSCFVFGGKTESIVPEEDMVENLKEIKKMLDEQVSYWETFVAKAPGENKEEKGSGDEEKEVSVVKLETSKPLKLVTGDKKADTKRKRRR